ncbi:TPA: ArsR/SmtB family transcription factor, partial [Bacillus cereus]
MDFYEQNATILKTISHPIRIQILNELITREKCNVTQLVELLNIPQSTVSQHLGKMKAQKIVVNKRQGLEVYYSSENPMI